MFLALGADEFAAVAGGFHHGRKRCGGCVRDRRVGFAVEDDGGRCAFFHVVRGRDIFRIGAHAFGGDAVAHVGEFQAGERGKDEGGIEKHQGIGERADLRVFAGAFETGDGGDRSSEVTAGRAAASGDTLRIDAEADGVGADPAGGGLGVGDAVCRFYLVTRGDAVVGGDGDHPARGEGAAVLFKLRGRTVGPAAAEEEDDRGTVRFGDGCGRFKNGERELGIADGFVDLGAGVGEGGRIGLGGDERGGCEGEQQGEEGARGDHGWGGLALRSHGKRGDVTRVFRGSGHAARDRSGKA